MVKHTSLSSDLDLIKELEELRIKQKLLVESLGKKKLSKDDELLINLDAKIDFLVKIFQESSSPEESEDESGENSHSKIMEKLNSIEENLNQKFEELSEKLLNSSITSEESKEPSKSSESTEKTSITPSNADSIESIPAPVVTPISSTETPKDSIPAPEIVSTSSSNNLPPIPNFKPSSQAEIPQSPLAPNSKLPEAPAPVDANIVGEKETKKKGKWF